MLVFDTVIIPNLTARSHWVSLTVVGFKHFEWASRSELNPKPYIGSMSTITQSRGPLQEVAGVSINSPAQPFISSHEGKTAALGTNRVIDVQWYHHASFW